MINLALVLTVGKATEPSIKRIKQLEPKLVYFIHSFKSKANAYKIIKETGIENYRFKHLDNHESVEDSFSKSIECIDELNSEGFDVVSDFTVGTKPMVAGLVLACIERDCTYMYLGESDENSRIDGMGPVRSGFEATKYQKNPYESFAIRELIKAKLLFNQYQFDESSEYFSKAFSKNEDKKTELFMKIAEFYSVWDKFSDRINNQDLNTYFKREIMDIIMEDTELFDYFRKNIPSFFIQLQFNHKFLDKKIPDTDDAIFYYLADLLTNAQRRLDEGKFDDAVARLYRCVELIAQIRLYQMNLINKKRFFKSKKVFIVKKEIFKRANGRQRKKIDKWNPKGWKNNHEIFLNMIESYKLLQILSGEEYDDFSRVTQNLTENYFNVLLEHLKGRNNSILAHGLKPLTEEEALYLFDEVLKHVDILCDNIEKFMKLAEFPEFDSSLI